VEVRDEYVADTTRYSGPLRAAAKDADKFKDKNDEAALAARRMGLAAKEAADKAARAQKDAADAAEKLAKGELKADEAARAAARAENELERASIKAAEAQRAAGRAADQAAANFKQMARDAALGAAAEDLAMLKASGRVKEHNAAVLKLRKEMPELGKDGSQAFRLMTSTSRSFGRGLDGLTSGMEDLQGIGRAAPAAILVGLQLLPAAASIAGGAITLGLGGALSFIGLKAQMTNKDVQKAFAGTKSAISSDLHRISAPFHQTLLTIAADAKRTWYGLSPTLEGAFAKMAPAISRFSSSFGDALQELNPAIDSIGTAFSRTLDKLGGRAPQIMNNIGTSIKAITDAVAANPDALPSFIQDVTELTRYMADGVGVLIRYSSEIKNAFEVANAAALGPVGDLALGILKLSHVSRDSGSGFQTVTRTFPTFAQQAIVAASGAHQLMTAEQAASLSANQLKTAMDNLTGKTLSEREAMVQYRSAITQMNQALKDNGHAHGFATQKGAQNEQALDGMASAAQRAAQAMRDNGKSTKEVSAFLDGARQRIVAMAEKMHYSASEAQALANKLLGIKPVKLSVDDRNFLAKLHYAQGLKLDPKTGLLKGNNSDYLNKWLKAKSLKIDTKTGLFKGNNADYYNKWLAANHLHIDTKTGRITGNTSAFWSAVHSIPQTVGYRRIGVYYVPLNSANEPGKTRADGGIDRYADGGLRRDLPPMIVNRPTVLFGETETGGEAYIPLGKSKRQRSTDLLGEVADMFGYALVPAMDGAIEKYAKGKVKRTIGIGKLERAQIARLHAASARLHLARSRPEELAAMAAQQALASMRRSVYGGFFRGGPSTPGSAHGTVVQHVTNVTLHVGGSIRSDQDIAKMIQRILVTNRMPVTLPAGRF
jgi:hypothetical protein